MLRKEKDGIACKLSTGHLKIIAAFFLGVMVCFTVIYFTSSNPKDDEGEWDDYDGVWEENSVPTYSDDELAAIRTTYAHGATCEKNAEHSKGCAYGIFVASPEYVEMAMTLVESIKSTETRLEIVLLCSSELPREYVRILENIENVEVVVIDEDVTVPESVSPWRDYWLPTYQKIRFWGLTDYERIAVYDADSIMMRNSDAIFDLPGEYLTATDRHLCTHESTPGPSTMLMVLWPDKERESQLQERLTSQTYNTFSRGDQSVTEAFFTQRDSIQQLGEDWSTFVYRCQCDDFGKAGETVLGQPGEGNGPASAHFTGWFRPHPPKIGNEFVPPAGLSAKAKECGIPFYNQWNAMRISAAEAQGWSLEELESKDIRHTTHSVSSGASGDGVEVAHEG